MVSIEFKQNERQHIATTSAAEANRVIGIADLAGRNHARMPFMARFAVINLVGLALVGAAWSQDWLFKPFAADHSGMSYLITALFLVGLGAVAWRDWQTVRWIGNGLVYLGMVGTVL